MSSRNAIFAIHGISPIQRYAFQDQVAIALRSYLNEQEQVAKTGLSWEPVIHWPTVAGTDAAVRPSALRIYRSDENDPENPTGTIYDVYEGYWSPLSKGRTNIRSALRWLLNALFLGSSSTANIPCTKEKLKSDLSYVGVLLGGAFLLLVVALVVGLAAWLQMMRTFALPPNVPFWDVLRDPLGNLLRLPVLAYVEFGIDILAVYVVAELIAVYRVHRKRQQRARELSGDAQPAQSRFAMQAIDANAFHRTLLYVLWDALIVLLVLAYVFAWLDGHLRGAAIGLFPLYVLFVTLSVAFMQSARALGDFAVENVLGDIQIYTTHDANSTFFAIRQQIIETVTSALMSVMSAADAKAAGSPYYDRIHIFGHSLGSTVAMDVLIRLRQLLQEGSLPSQHWPRIRSFTTFGTALEKTRFFFDVRQPTISAASDQWENDVYGRLFTNDATALDRADNQAGIYWSNVWYFRDIVANEISSYESDVLAAPSTLRFVWNTTPAPRTICANFNPAHARPRLAWVHSDYLADDAFWRIVGPVLTQTTVTPPAPDPAVIA